MGGVIRPGGPGHSSYVIVPESKTPHSTVATAQVLPDIPYFGVIGTLGSEDSVDVFRMPISAGTAGIQFELVSQRPSSTPLQLSLFDASGQVVAHWSTSPGPDGASTTFTLPGLPAGSNLFLGISMASPSSQGGATPTAGYQLWVTRLDGTELSSTSTAGAEASTSIPSAQVIAAPFQPTINLSSSSPTPAGTAAAAVSTSAGASVAIAIGSLPTRSASPLGGIVADGNTATLAGSQLGEAVDPESVDQVAQASLAEAGVEAGSKAEPVHEGGPKTLVALRGPGGYPLLGAAAIGNWRAAHALASAEPADSEDVTADQVVEQELPTDTVATLAEADPPPVVDSSGLQTRGVLRASLSSGLGLAMVLTLNAVLSDPVAGFDYLASRLDPYARWPRRRRKERSSTDNAD